jgi:hypothetical protein
MSQQRTIKSIIALAVLLAVVWSIVAVQPSEAIPAFARKYSMSCTTCHQPMPRLKDYGDEFAGNGFVLKDQDAPRYTMKTGDEHLSLIRDLPIAVRLEGFVKYDSYTEKNVDLTTPYNLKFLSGGSLGKNVAYYFYFFFSERGEVAGIEDAFIMFNNVFNTELDVYFGQFQVSDPLFKRELRLTYEDYQVYRVEPGLSGINLTYDRGFMFTYGLESGTDFIVELLNGNGIGPADEFRTYDDDKYKCVAGRVSQDAGEYVRLGGFGYYGKEKNTGQVNEVFMAGPDVTLSLDKVELNGQYMWRQDDNPFFATNKPGDKLVTDAIMAEAILWPNGDQSRWYGAAVYNWVDSDDPLQNYETISGHAGYLFRTNIRHFVEYTYDIDNEESRIVTGFVAAF